jgi:hypothetical protein
MPAKRTRRQFITTGASAAVGFSLFPTLRIEAESRFDLVIRNGTILDGTGGPTGTRASQGVRSSPTVGGSFR